VPRDGGRATKVNIWESTGRYAVRGKRQAAPGAHGLVMTVRRAKKAAPTLHLDGAEIAAYARWGCATERKADVTII
jgi:hypothetical protein